MFDKRMNVDDWRRGEARRVEAGSGVDVEAALRGDTRIIPLPVAFHIPEALSVLPYSLVSSFSFFFSDQSAYQPTNRTMGERRGASRFSYID